MSWFVLVVVIVLLVASAKVFIPFVIRRAVRGAAKRVVKNVANETRERVVEAATKEAKTLRSV